MAYTAMPWSRTRCAAAASCVDSGFEAHSTTSAPPALSVTARLAVSVVTCRQALRRRPLRGRSFANRSRISLSTGIERSAHSTRRRPSSASARSFTSWASCLVAIVIVARSYRLAARAAPASRLAVSASSAARSVRSQVNSSTSLPSTDACTGLRPKWP